MIIRLSFILVFNFVKCARILTYFGLPSASHQNAFRPIWEELAARGHEVTAITPNPTNSSLPNLRVIDVSVGYEIFKNVDLSNNRRSEMSVFGMCSNFLKFGDGSMELEMKSTKFQEVLGLEKNHFDLLIVEAHMAQAYGLQHKFDAPLIAISSMGAWSYIHNIFGNPIHPSIYPEQDSGLVYFQNLSVWEKIDSLYVTTVFWLVLKFISIPRADEFSRTIFGYDMPYIEELMKRTSILFLNKNPIFSDRRPNAPNVMEYYHTNHAVAPLPNELQEMLDNANEGLVYFSFGTNVRLEHVDGKIKTVIMKALGSLPYTVLCKWHTDEIVDKPKNVIIRKVWPQRSILAHRNVKVFVTQGGLQSSEEAIENAVPMVVIPFLGDQPMNAEILKHHGMGEKIPINDLDDRILHQKIMEVARNKKYRLKARELREILLDQPQSGIDKIIWWCEYVMRHKGAKHLRSPSADISLYEYFMLDVFSVIFFAVLIIYKLSSIILRYIIHLFIKKDDKLLKSE